VVTAAILAGGRGTRLGGAKPTAQLAGLPLISYPVAAAHEAGLEVLVVGKRGSPLPALDCEIVLEPDEPFHPLLGIVTAIEARPAGALVIGCDMPFVSAELLRHLAQRRSPLVASVGGKLEPLLGIYDENALGVLRDALAAQAPLREAVAALGPELVDQAELSRFGEPEMLVTSVNSPEALERAAGLLG
jgi:molybdopterin-guanine dinucleotide biosynthesis protein A